MFVLFSKINSIANISAMYFKDIILEVTESRLCTAMRTPPPLLRNFLGLNLSIGWISGQRLSLNVLYYMPLAKISLFKTEGFNHVSFNTITSGV